MAPKINTTVRVQEGMLEIVDALADHEGISQSDLIRRATRTYVLRRIEEDPACAEAVRDLAQTSLNEHLTEMAKLFGSQLVESLIVPPLSEIQPDTDR